MYFRASNNANLYTNAGSFYAVELTNIAFGAAGCTARMNLFRRDAVAGVTSLVSYSDIACTSDFQLAVLVRGQTVVIYRPDIQNALLIITLPAEHASPGQAYFQPGVGASLTPAGGGIKTATVYPMDAAPPNAPPVPIVSTSAGKAEMQWFNASDAGAGVAYHEVWRTNAATPNAWDKR